MQGLLLAIAASTLTYLLFTIIEFKIGFKKIKKLSHQAILPNDKLPKVAVIFSALNEEKHLPDALQSFLALNYPNLEIIAVNDRSTDNTPFILERFKKTNTNLNVHHIKELPQDWIGKNHALHVAATHTQADWLLFTDADVIMKSDVITKAVSYAITHQLDHLTIYENHLHKNFWLSILLFGIYISYGIHLKPWRIRYRWSKKYLGYGAFNLVKRETYLNCGGHAAIALECLDDMKLGQLIKTNGYTQDTVDGDNLVEREWYSSLKEMINGLKKNSFASFDYNLFKYSRDSFLALIFFFLPFVAIFYPSPLVKTLNFIIIGLMLYLSLDIAKSFRLKKIFFLFYPAAIGLLLYTTLQSVIATYKNNGVIWRETHYPLKKLKTKKQWNKLKHAQR